VLTPEFVRTTLILLAIAAAFGLLVAALVYAGGARNPKRYRPGRPFTFTPVWFLSAPEQQSRAGIAAPVSSGRELTAAVGRIARPRETGGASDRW
jgi:hypothetical protein